MKLPVLIAAALLAGTLQASPTVSEPAAPAAASARPAWMPAVAPDRGLVIIFREKRFYGSANAMKVFADEGVPLPKLKNGRFVHHYLEPGDHRLYADKRKQRDARIVGIEAGQVYFFEARFEARAMHGVDVDLVPLEDEEGLRRVGQLESVAKG